MLNCSILIVFLSVFLNLTLVSVYHCGLAPAYASFLAFAQSLALLAPSHAAPLRFLCHLLS